MNSGSSFSFLTYLWPTGIQGTWQKVNCMVKSRATNSDTEHPRLETTPLSLGKETGQVTINDSSSLRTEFCGSGSGKRVWSPVLRFSILWLDLL